MDLRRELMKTFWSCLSIAFTTACVDRLIVIAQGAPLSSVTIWNYVGEPISVHCHDQFTDLMRQEVPHDTDYIFTFYQNPDGTTMYSCSFVWELNKTQGFPVWEEAKVQTDPAKNCGDGRFKCLYKVTKEGFYTASPALGQGGLSNWVFINNWKVKSLVK